MSAGIMNVPTWLFFSKKVKMYVTSFATMFIYTKAEIVPLDNLDLKPKIAITE
jgi:hypothetical protein